jgi:coenzyme F420-reducing hydrogenase delta subunit/Pyruvate/2-oxoacid:ferredoxin oxidoreductase delta subunit
MIDTTKKFDTAARESQSEVPPVVRSSVLVIGGSISAAQVVPSLQARGLEVTMLQAQADASMGLGGAMAGFLETIAAVSGDVPEALLCPGSPKDLAKQLGRCQTQGARFISSGQVRRCTGQAGDFEVLITRPGADGLEIFETITVGAIVLAGETFGPARLAAEDFGIEPTRAITNLPGLMLNIEKGYIPRSLAVVMDLAAEQGILTSSVVFAAARYLARRGCRQIRVYCRNARVASTGLEELYRSARSAGVEFCRHDGKVALAETSEGLIEASSLDCELGEDITGRFDLLALADLTETDTDEPGLAFGIRPGPGQANNIWLSGGQTNRRGIFNLAADGINGSFHTWQDETNLVVHEISQLLTGPAKETPGDPARVDPDKCIACLTCVRLCPHGAIGFDEKEPAAEISKIACRQCGICVAECPAQAIELPQYTDERILSQLPQGPGTTVFACENSAIPAWQQNEPNPAGVQVIEVPCAGKVDPRNILKAFERGAEKVLVLGCNPGSCKFFDGPDRARNRLTRLREMLSKVGIDPEALRYEALTANEFERFTQLVKEK